MADSSATRSTGGWSAAGSRPRSCGGRRASPSRLSEDLGTPRGALGPEEHVGARARAVAYLFDPQRPRQLRPGEAAEVDGAERGHIAAELRLVWGSLDALAADAPAARVPWAKPVGDLHHHGAVGRVRARRERRANIYQANPEPVTEVEAEPARLAEQQPERMVERQQPCPDARHPVDVQQVPPDPP